MEIRERGGQRRGDKQQRRGEQRRTEENRGEQRRTEEEVEVRRWGWGAEVGL